MVSLTGESSKEHTVNTSIWTLSSRCSPELEKKKTSSVRKSAIARNTRGRNGLFWIIVLFTIKSKRSI
jgi:hypothetical protein